MKKLTRRLLESESIGRLLVAQLPRNPSNPTPDELDEFAGSQYHWKREPQTFQELQIMVADQLHSDYSENGGYGDPNEEAYEIVQSLQKTGKAVQRWYTFVLLPPLPPSNPERSLAPVQERKTDAFNDLIVRIRHARKTGDKAKEAIAKDELERLAIRHDRMKDPEVLDALS